MTFNPRNITSRAAADHFDNYSRVPWSIFNQKLPDKLSLYDFYFLTGLLPKGSREGANILIFFIFFVGIIHKREKLRLEMKFLRVCGFLKKTGLSRLPVEA